LDTEEEIHCLLIAAWRQDAFEGKMCLGKMVDIWENFATTIA